MQDWSEGYTTDIAYTHGYYSELNPLRARFALLAAGIAPPEVKTACELGFGQGVSINVHDAASGVEWYGTDFNPVQAGFARELAGGTALAGRLFDDAFEAFCRRTDLPDFDFIGLHGIWSWISDANRAVVTDFIRRKLKVGGVLYISYNTQPGWAAIAPLRGLMTGYADALAAPGIESAKRIDAALDFADRLIATGAAYGKQNPVVAAQLKSLRGQDRSYLAHEYFNRDWEPMLFTRMAEWLGAAKLQFAASAHFIDHVSVLNLEPAQQRLLDEIPDKDFRQTARDFVVNQRFRRDYWVRGARRLPALEQVERLRAERVVLAKAADKVELSTPCRRGTAALSPEIYRPILDFLSDFQVRTLGEIERAVTGRGVTFGKVLEAILVLGGNGTMHLAQAPDAVEGALVASRRLNERLCRRGRSIGDIGYLASPVTGGGITIVRMAQLLLLARSTGLREPAGWARYAADVLDAQGERLIHDGKPIASSEEQLTQLTAQAQYLARHGLPVLQALGILEQEGS